MLLLCLSTQQSESRTCPWGSLKVAFGSTGVNLEGNVRGKSSPPGIGHLLKDTRPALGYVPTTPRGVIRLGPHQGREQVEQQKLALILDRSTDSTQLTYSSQWAWWDTFCRSRAINPYRKVEAENFDAEESLFLDYILHSTATHKWAPGTIKLRLAAIRARHLAYGYKDPLCDMTRVYMAVGGYKKRYGTNTRRKPVTVSMLKWIRSRLDPRKCPNDAAAWAAILVGFFFLLRASEYVKSDGSKVDNGRGLRGCDLVFRTLGQVVKLAAHADEMGLTVRGSKTDKFNLGEVRNHFRVEEKTLCVITAMGDYQYHFPDRFGPLCSQPLFTWDNGKFIQRVEIQVILERAASACGVDPGSMGSHSLRFGGASALWAAFRDTGLVQRWGRWSSDAFQGYLWESRDNAKGIAEGMIKADVVVV